ncbi:D-alanyl-D-alanine carboxypeptidase family protein [uncultured Paracoccus sp.]|uniref:D-alanyl-D-alanine carboxypeptidase family protein n=1 Tax=uncultured Paracoccus sp. TaxID=189685 RepID=UPI0026313208|nr:D-alanyl-D-alanine carboxypeptidase family protein [uncultured Paracoccus sp.]
MGWLVLFGTMLPHAAAAAPYAAHVMDARTGKDIYSKNADARLHPASLTKMMTLYMAFRAIESGQVRLDSRFTVTNHAAAQPPSRLGLRAGQQIELRYLIRAAAVKSANDAATAIAEGLAGSEAKFGAQMTQMARALGMQNTVFRNANGLTMSGHYSSARDMSTLGRRLFYDFPQYYSIFSRRTAHAGVANVSSTNRRFLDSYAGADGIKTGYTRAAGFNLTASAQRGNKRIIATVMGGTSTAQRNAKMAELLDIGFGRAPNRVNEVRPSAPLYAVEKKRAVKVARVAQQPVPQVTVRVSAAARPTARGKVVRLADRRAIAVAVAAAQPVRAQGAAAQEARSGSLRLSQSARPARRSNGAAAASATQTDRAVAVALAEPPPQAAEANSSASAGLVRSDRPAAAPRARKRADVTTAATFRVAEAAAPPAAPPVEAEPLEEGDRSDDSIALSRSAKPKPRTDMIILAAMGTPGASPAASEVVSRSRSRKGSFGISLGLYRSRAEAENLLLKTALQESAALDDARRNVADTVRGFEPHFVGLSKSAATLVCEKLAARQQTCKVVPG